MTFRRFPFVQAIISVVFCKFPFNHFLTAVQYILQSVCISQGHPVAQLVEVTSRKVAGSIPYGVIGILHSHNPSDCTMAMGLTQPLTEMSTRNTFCGVKTAGA